MTRLRAFRRGALVPQFERVDKPVPQRGHAKGEIEGLFQVRAATSR